METTSFLAAARLADGRVIKSRETLLAPTRAVAGHWRGRPKYFHPLARLLAACISEKEGVDVREVRIVV